MTAPNPDLDALLDPLFKFAQQMLEKHGSFLPFGATVGRDGRVALAAGHTGDDQANASAIIELLVGGFREQAGTQGIRAAGLCVDVRVVPPGASAKADAICAQLEHANGEAVDVYLPYKKHWLGRFTYGEIFASARDARVFARP